jgi:hypothetical protein
MKQRILTTGPLVPGESAHDRKLRLQRNYHSTHMAQRRDYETKQRKVVAEIRRAANPPSAKGGK